MADTIGEVLRKIRVNKNLSQEIISDALQITLSSYSRYERGVTEPKFETIVKICDFYQISLDEFYRYGNPNYKLFKIASLKHEIDSEVPMNWGDLIKRVREQKGITQQNLAEELKVDKSTIVRWERVGKIKTSMLEKIAKALGVKLSDLYTYHTNPTLIIDPISDQNMEKAKVRITVELDGSITTLNDRFAMLKRINQAIAD